LWFGGWERKNKTFSMAIGPISDSHRQISVVEPLSPAFEYVKKVLFQPFDIGKWFVLGFCAWLAQLGESGGGGGNFGGNNFNSHNNNNYASQESAREWLERAREYIMGNLNWLVPLAIFLILFVLALWIVMLWLNCRGKFMFLHCVALNKGEIVEPWNRFAAHGLSLFWFRLALGLVGMILILPILGVGAVLVLKMIFQGMPVISLILALVGLSLIIVCVAIVLGLIQKFTIDFVVPIMYLRGVKCLDAWRELWGLLCAQPGLFTLYILFQIVIGIAISFLVVVVMIITCCVCCLIFIPYISTVLLLPIFVFKRSFSLYFLRQFGPEYDVFPPPPPTPAAPTGLQPVPGQPV
jgi:hypothetical protein